MARWTPKQRIAAQFTTGALGLGMISCSDTSGSVYVLGRLPASGERDAGAGGTGAPDAAMNDGHDASARPDAGGGEFEAGGAGGDATECAVTDPVRDYVFSGVGTQVVDQRGGAPGRVLGGATLDGSGELVLDGHDDYVDLPNDLLLGLTEVTVVAWIRHLGGPAYTRLFDFGTGSDGEDPEEGAGTVGSSYLAVTPATGFVPRYLAALVSSNGSAGEIAAPTDVRLDDALHMVALSVSSLTLELSHDGVLVARDPNSVMVGSIEDVNNWLGRSQYDQDPYWSGAYTRVQVFGRALPECAIRALYSLGPAA